MKFSKTHDTNKKFNRRTSQFVYSKVAQYLSSRCYKEGIELRKVNPRFTSLIGEYKYQSTFGISGHEAAAFVIARRGLGLKEQMPKPIQEVFSLVKEGELALPPKAGKEGWGFLYGLDKRCSNRTKGNVLLKELLSRLQVCPENFLQEMENSLLAGAKLPGPPATTVKMGPVSSKELVGIGNPK